MAKLSGFDQIHAVSFVKVMEDEGFTDVSGVSEGMLVLIESRKNGKAVGIYGNDLESAEFFVGDDRAEVVAAFTESEKFREINSIFGGDKASSFFCELIGGVIEGDLSDFEFENNCSVSLGDSDNELDLDSLIGRVGLSVSTVAKTKISFDMEKKIVNYKKQDIDYLGDLFNELQYDGETRVAIL